MGVDWLAGLDAAQAMMVDDLDDLGLLDALNGLAALVVVDEDDLLALRHDHVVAGNDADETAVLDDRIVAVVRLLHRTLDIRKHVKGLEADRILVHDAADRHALVDQAGYRIRIIRRRKDEDALGLSSLDDLTGQAAATRDDHAGNALGDDVEHRLIMAVADEHDILLIDDLLDGLDAASCDADAALDELALVAGYEHLTVRSSDEVTIAHAHLREVLHRKLLEITLGKIRNRNDADKQALAVRNGNGLELMLTHDLAEMAQRIMLLDDDLAIHRDILDTRVEIRQEQRLLNLEMLERILRLSIDLASTSRDNILAERLLQVCIADSRADGVRIWIAMTNRVNRFRILHGLEKPPQNI